jgi:TrmH family RNA methyltransferase
VRREEDLKEIHALPHHVDPESSIASRKNPLIRRIARLDQDAATRQEEGLYLLWGWKIVEEGLREPARLERILVGARVARQAAGRTLVRRARKEDLPVSLVEEEVLNDVVPGAGDQGLLALARMSRATVEQMVNQVKDPIVLVADRIQDPGNMGTLIRLGEAAGIAGVLIVPGTVDPYHTRAVRSSAGSILRVPVARISGPADLRDACRERGLRIAATLPEGGVSLESADLHGAMALVVGNEGEGLSREWTDASQLKLTVSLAARIQSLNVTLATAMILYEAYRQRRVSPKIG